MPSYSCSRYSAIRSVSTGSRLQSRSRPYLGENVFLPRDASVKHGVSLKDLSPAASRVRQRLDSKKEHPAAILRSLTASETAVPLDALLLPLRELRAINAEMPPSIRARERIREQIAAALLQYLWTHEELWWNFACDAHDELNTLCVYADAEGIGNYIVDWLAAPVPSIDSEAKGKKAGSWRGYILRSLVKAQILSDELGAANKALETFFEVCNRKDATYESEQTSDGPGVLSRLSLKPAIIELRATLLYACARNTRADLYDRFMWIHAGYGTLATEDMGLSQAQLALSHPTKPSAQLAVSVIEKCLSDSDARKTVSERIVQSEGRYKGLLRIFFLRTRAQLWAAGDHTSADEIATKYQALTGDTLSVPIRRHNSGSEPRPRRSSGEFRDRARSRKPT